MHFPVAGIHAALSGLIEFSHRPLAWIADKRRPTQFASRKNRPGIDYASKSGAPVHRNHRQRLVKFIADLPSFNIQGCKTGRLSSEHENQANTPKTVEEKSKQKILLIDDGFTPTA